MPVLLGNCSVVSDSAAPSVYRKHYFRPQHSQGARKKGSVNLTFPIECLPELMAACDEREDFLYGLLSDELSRSHIDQVRDQLKYLVLTN